VSPEENKAIIDGGKSMSDEERTDPNRDDLGAIYQQLCNSYHAIRDFRAKLLGFLPLASGGGIALLLKRGPSVHLIALGSLGFLVTVGLFLYEFHNMRKCHRLIYQGAELEKTLGDGQFRAHPLFEVGGCNTKHTWCGLHFAAALCVYFSVMASWLYVLAVGVWFAVCG
jgi:hypothetical protein